MRKSIQDAKDGLYALKNDIIGVFKYRADNAIELVVEVNRTTNTVDTVIITQYGAVQQSYGLPLSYGNIFLFPKGMNMNDMFNNPYMWEDFIKRV